MNTVDSNFLKEFLEIVTVNPKTYLLQKIFTDILPKLTSQDKQIIGYYLRRIEEANQEAIAVGKLISSKDYLSVILPTDQFATCTVGRRIQKNVLKKFEDKLSPDLKTRRNHGLFLMALYNAKIKCTDRNGKDYELNYGSLTESVQNHKLQLRLLRYQETNNILTKNIWSGVNFSFSDDSWFPERVLHNSLFNRTEITTNTNNHLLICSFKQKNVTLKLGKKLGNIALASLTNKPRDQACKKFSIIVAGIGCLALSCLLPSAMMFGTILILRANTLLKESVNDLQFKPFLLGGVYLNALIIFGQMYLLSRQYLNRKTEVSKLPLLLKDDGRLTDERLLKVANVLNYSICPDYSREDMLAYICLLTLYIKAQNQAQSLESFLNDNSISYEQYYSELDVDRLLSQNSELQFAAHIAHVLKRCLVQFELSQQNYHMEIRNSQMLLWPGHLAQGNVHQSQTPMLQTLMEFEKTSLITNFNQKHQRDINSCENALHAKSLNMLMTPGYRKRMKPMSNQLDDDALHQNIPFNKSGTVAIQPLIDKNDIENQMHLYHDHQFEDFQKNRSSDTGRMLINAKNYSMKIHPLNINDIEMQRFR